MTTKEMIGYLELFNAGQIVTNTDVRAFKNICDTLRRRIPKGRPKVFENDQARWRFHSERRKAERHAKKRLDTEKQDV